MGTGIDDIAVLTAALEGLVVQRNEIDQQIDAVKARLVEIGGRRALAAAGVPRTRTLSKAARDRIAAAQKKRWDEYRKKKSLRATKS